MPTPHFDTTIHSNSVSVGTTLLIGVCNLSLNILILYEEADCLWLKSNDLFSTEKVCTNFCFGLNWQTFLNTPQYVCTLIIRSVNFQNFFCNYSKSETIQIHFFAINQVLCTVMRGPTVHSF
jgi:hypothetical protein